MQAYSVDTETTYEDWDALVAAESNGYVVLGTTTREGTVPVVVGPYPTKAEAAKARARLKRKWQRDEDRDHGDGYKINTLIRVLWKENR